MADLDQRLRDGRRVFTATKEIIRDGKTGYIVRKVSKKALAKAINKVLDLSDAEYNAMSEQAVEDVKKRFSWRYFVEEMLSI